MSKKVAIILLLCSIVFAPSLRSCGDITYGFPTVAIEAKSPVAVDMFKPINALINIIVIVLLFFVLMLLRLNNNFKRVFDEGLKGIYAYQLILFFSYLVLFWCIRISEKFLMMIYVLYPLCTSILDLDKPLLGTISEHSRFFGDKFDIVVRLNYLFSLLLWFLAAILISRINKIYFKQRRNNY